MGNCSSRTSTKAALAIGIGILAITLGAVVLFSGPGDNAEGSSNAIPFMVIMLGSAGAIAGSGGGCCCLTKLFNRSKHRAQAGVEENPYAHRGN